MIKLHLALYAPEIPYNTGAVGRICSTLNASLHLIHPLGFILSEKHVKRAGLDYWDTIEVSEYADLDDFSKSRPKTALFFLSSKLSRSYTEIAYPQELTLLFGSESSGLPQDNEFFNDKQGLKIPMHAQARCHNLATSVAIVSYEFYRQHNFAFT